HQGALCRNPLLAFYDPADGFHRGAHPPVPPGTDLKRKRGRLVPLCRTLIVVAPQKAGPYAEERAAGAPMRLMVRIRLIVACGTRVGPGTLHMLVVGGPDWS